MSGLGEFSNTDIGPFGSLEFLEAMGTGPYHTSKEASGILIEVAMKATGIPSRYQIGKMLDLCEPSFASKRYWGGPKAIGGFYLARLFYAMALTDPRINRHTDECFDENRRLRTSCHASYWTPARLQHIDWNTIHLHPYGIAASKELKEKMQQLQEKKERKAQIAKGRHVVPAARPGVPEVHRHKDRPVAAGHVA